MIVRFRLLLCLAFSSQKVLGGGQTARVTVLQKQPALDTTGNGSPTDPYDFNFYQLENKTLDARVPVHAFGQKNDFSLPQHGFELYDLGAEFEKDAYWNSLRRRILESRLEKIPDDEVVGLTLPKIARIAERYYNKRFGGNSSTSPGPGEGLQKETTEFEFQARCSSRVVIRAAGGTGATPGNPLLHNDYYSLREAVERRVDRPTFGLDKGEKMNDMLRMGSESDAQVVDHINLWWPWDSEVKGHPLAFLPTQGNLGEVVRWDKVRTSVVLDEAYGRTAEELVDLDLTNSFEATLFYKDKMRWGESYVFRTAMFGLDGKRRIGGAHAAIRLGNDQVRNSLEARCLIVRAPKLRSSPLLQAEWAHLALRQEELLSGGSSPVEIHPSAFLQVVNGSRTGVAGATVLRTTFPGLSDLHNCQGGFDALWRLPLLYSPSQGTTLGPLRVAGDVVDSVVDWAALSGLWSSGPLVETMRQNFQRTLRWCYGSDSAVFLADPFALPENRAFLGLNFAHSAQLRFDLRIAARAAQGGRPRSAPLPLHHREDVLLKKNRAFEMVLGLALGDYEPATRAARKLALWLVDAVERIYTARNISEDEIPWKDLFSHFPGVCYLGWTDPQFSTKEELLTFFGSANLREILAKIHRLLEYGPSDEPLTHALFEELKTSPAGRQFVERRLSDPTGVLARYRMPHEKVGLGWTDLTRVTTPTRLRVSREKLRAAVAEQAGHSSDHPEKIIRGQVQARHLRPALSQNEKHFLEEKKCAALFKEAFVDGTTSHGGAGTPKRRKDDTLPVASGALGVALPTDMPFRKFAESVHMPTAAGPSTGTTVVFMQAAEVMLFQAGVEQFSPEGVNYLAVLRLALLAWQLPTRDHSLLEVLAAAARSFKGRSYPEWCGNVEEDQHGEGAGASWSSSCDEEPEEDHWSSVHQRLVPFGEGRTQLKAHVEKHMEQMRNSESEKGLESLAWPGVDVDQAGGSPGTGEGAPSWWDAPFFAEYLDTRQDTFVAQAAGPGSRADGH